jgi:hypothetical protein
MSSPNRACTVLAAAVCCFTAGAEIQLPEGEAAVRSSLNAIGVADPKRRHHHGAVPHTHEEHESETAQARVVVAAATGPQGPITPLYARRPPLDERQPDELTYYRRPRVFLPGT